MSYTKNILSPFFAALLCLALLFPSIFQFADTLEGHEHTACNDVTTHIHEKNLDCSLCDFQFSTFQLDLSNINDALVLETSPKQEIGITSSKKCTFFYNFYLRGPPVIS